MKGRGSIVFSGQSFLRRVRSYLIHRCLQSKQPALITSQTDWAVPHVKKNCNEFLSHLIIFPFLHITKICTHLLLLLNIVITSFSFLKSYLLDPVITKKQPQHMFAEPSRTFTNSTFYKTFMFSLSLQNELSLFNWQFSQRERIGHVIDG